MKPGDYFRASSLPYLCPREEVLANRYEIIRGDDNPPGLQITFDIGHAFHYLYRNVYLGPMGEWLGAWECVKCGWNTDKAKLSKAPIPGKNRGKLAQMPSKCGDCGATAMPCSEAESDGIESDIVFMEWELFDDRLMIKGHPDGWDKLAGYSRILGDMKSFTSTRFNTIKRVQPKHDVQLWAYMFMCDDEYGSIFYLNKSPWGDYSSFIREMVAPPSDKVFDQLVRKPMEDLNNGLDGGVLPDIGCISQTCPRAKECQLSELCFSVK